VVPDFVNLFARQALRDGWGDIFNHFLFGSWVGWNQFSKLCLDFSSNIYFVGCVELVPTSFINGQYEGESCFPKRIQLMDFVAVPVSNAPLFNKFSNAYQGAGDITSIV